MTDGLKDRHRKAIIDILAANPRVERVVLFGSRAMRTFTTTSDVDLALYGDDLTLTDQAKLAAAIDRLPMAQRVDLLLFKTIDNEKLKAHIRKHGREWFARGGGRSADWPMRKVSDIAVFLNHKRVPVKSLERAKRQGPYPYYGASGIVDYIDDYIFDGTYLLVSEDGENLHSRKTPIAFKATGKFWVNNHAHILAEKEEGGLDYLEYYFSKLDLTPYITGAVQPKLNKANLDRIEIPFPEKGERLAINNVLNSLTNKIELNRQINKTLEEMAQAIFKSWFVDFEPVKAKILAKANGQDPERAAMRAISGAVQGGTNVAGARTAGATKTEEELDHLPPDQLAQLRNTAALFPDELTDSELGPIPKGWEVKEIREWGAVICGKTPPKKDANNYGGDVPFIKIPDMHGNVFATTTNDSLSQKGASTQPKKQVLKGSICVSCIATVGQVVIASEDSHTNQQINSIVPDKMSNNYYLFFSMRERTGLLHDLASGGSATLNLNTGNFSKIPLLFPGESLLNEYFRNVDSSFRSILLNDRQSQVLAELRDTLPPKLLSGEIDLSRVA